MGITVTIRDSVTPCYFKEYLFKLLDIFPEVDEILICSGYFQERKPYIINNNTNQRQIGRYEATRDTDMRQNSMVRRFRGLNRITTVGIRDSLNSDWGVAYRNFVNSLRACMGNDHVDAFYDRQQRWHAKEMIMLVNGRAVAGIVGSSNITQPAYGISFNNEFNIESDTFIYDSRHDLEMAQYATILRENGEEAFVLVGHNNEVGTGGTETAVLDRQYRKIMRMVQDTNRFDVL